MSFIRYGTSRWGLYRWGGAIAAEGGEETVDTIPNYWEWKNQITSKKENARIFIPQFGSSITSLAEGFANPGLSWEIGNEDSSYENFIVIRDFFRSHRQFQFYLHDPQLLETRLYEMEINTKFEFHYNHADSFSWKFSIRECYPFELIV